MTKKNIIISGLIVVVVSALGYYYYQLQNKDKVYYWRSVSIERGDINVLITATGTMAADTSVDVGVQVSGTIANIKADFNTIVKKNQILAVLDTTLYYATKLDALAALQRTQVAFEQAKREFDRASLLFNSQVIAQVDYDLSLTAYQTAKSNVVSAKSLLNKAAINLRYCTIKAPISGMIISRNVQIGNMVIASFTSPVLFTIANNLKKMQVQANVDEADIGQLKVGQKAIFTVDAYPNDVFSGEVTQIRHSPVVVSSVVNYVVIIEVPNPALKLIPGLTVNANISIQEQKNVLKVATSAFAFTPTAEYIQNAVSLSENTKRIWLQKLLNNSELKKQEIVETNGTKGYLWVINDKDVIPVQVTKGLNDGAFTEISGSIKEGYLVATGINQSAPTETKASNPFMPKMPSRKKAK
ncbi:efflux RND transporter periplasmic adaptor subunit [Arcicella aquatica]|uniref:Efflux RND transporter periplasmic adaptor subunit n=1 Tax=Arcicella aquatica TaxID=217141 RepID=A0ABU5QTX1_9BACT|nr:efflux RND transporter periplasmic adaptor subunit [Arcicella aquatica]MEA5260463.1 efflux RND transporter periplasmic adaptor subunit [Arcicella aquatica]